MNVGRYSLFASNISLTIDLISARLRTAEVGYIAEPAEPIPGGIPPDAVLALVDCLTNQS